MRSMAMVYIGAGVTTRLLDPNWMRNAVSHSRQAVEVLQNQTRDVQSTNHEVRRQLVAAWRDQAKPLCFTILNDANRSLDRKKNAIEFAEVVHALNQAQIWCGGSEPLDESTEDWVVTRLIRIECLAAMGETEQAIREEEHLYDQSWATPILSAKPHFPVASKAAMTSLASSYCRGGFPDVISNAERLTASIDPVQYAKRRNRIITITEAALTGDHVGLRCLFVR